jgi:hypothetical protein
MRTRLSEPAGVKAITISLGKMIARKVEVYLGRYLGAEPAAAWASAQAGEEERRSFVPSLT